MREIKTLKKKTYNNDVAADLYLFYFIKYCTILYIAKATTPKYERIAIVSITSEAISGESGTLPVTLVQ